jgi:hypothetical protein
MITREHEQTERYIADLEAELTRLKADVTGFAEWVVINKWHLLGGVWYCTGMQDDSSKHLTTSELYQEYLKQKQ